MADIRSSHIPRVETQCPRESLPPQGWDLGPLRSLHGREFTVSDVACVELTGIHPLGCQGKQVTEKWFNRGTRVHNHHSRDARGSSRYLDAAPASTHDRSLALQKHRCCGGCGTVKARALQETSTSRAFRAAGVTCWRSREGKLLPPPVSLQSTLPTMLNITPAGKGGTFRVLVHFHRAGKRGWIWAWEATNWYPAQTLQQAIAIGSNNPTRCRRATDRHLILWVLPWLQMTNLI